MDNQNKEEDLEVQLINKNQSKSYDKSISLQNIEVMEQLEEKIKKQNLIEWAQNIGTFQGGEFAYPADYQISLEKMHNSYIIPDLKEGEPKRPRFYFLKYDIEQDFIPKYGITIPIYFQLLKLQIIILTFVGLLFGIMFSCKSFQASQEYCQNPESSRILCQIVRFQFFVPLNQLIGYLSATNFSLQAFYTLAGICFVIITLYPFASVFLLRINYEKYWKEELKAHPEFEQKKSIYIKHVPIIMSPEQIISAFNELWLNRGNSAPLFDESQETIIEQITVLDYSEVSRQNLTRQEKFLKLLQISLEINKLNQQELSISEQIYDEFAKTLSEIAILSKQIEISLGELNFANKIILTMSTVEQKEKIEKAFLRTQIGFIKSHFAGLQNVNRYHSDSAKKQSNKVELNQSDQFGFLPLQYEESDNYNKNDSPVDQKITLYQYLNNDIIKEEATKRMTQINPINISSENVKDIQFKKPPRRDDIDWNNMGVHSFQKLKLRLIFLTISIVLTSIIILVYEGIFAIQNQPKIQSEIYQGNIGFGKLVIYYLLNLFISIISVLAGIIIVIMTNKTKRTTYTNTEQSQITFNSIFLMVFMLSFPWYFVLIPYRGLYKDVAIYNLVSLCEVRVFFKAITNAFHVRLLFYWYRRRNILKQINPQNYFQFQLDKLLQPPYFPIRSRLFNINFVFWTGCLILYIAPYVITFCVLCLLFFLFVDYYGITRLYLVDPYFNYSLLERMNYQINIIMIPIFTAVFGFISFPRKINYPSNEQQSDSTVYNSNSQGIFIFGLSWAFLTWFIFTFFNKQIVNIVLYKFLGYQEKKEYFYEANYTSSYENYQKSLRVTQLDQTLIQLYQTLKFNQKLVQHSNIDEFQKNQVTNNPDSQSESFKSFAENQENSYQMESVEDQDSITKGSINQ